jgi:hypothetical protein
MLETAIITNRYLIDKRLRLREFADGLGLPNIKRQHVFNWKRGINSPEPMTLFRVIASPASKPWAKAWAGECLSILQQPAVLAGVCERALEMKEPSAAAFQEKTHEAQ